MCMCVCIQICCCYYYFEFFQDFSLSLIFSSFKMRYLDVVFWAFILTDVLWVSWICGMVFEMNLGDFSVVTMSNISSVSFSLFYSSGIPTMHMLHFFVVFSQSLDVLFCFLCLCSLYFSVSSDSIYISSSAEILSSLMSSVLVSPSKAFLLSVTVFLIYSISFWFFIRTYISLLALSICSFMLSTLFIRALAILIIIILNS